ncbi:MAG: hypothetical protein K6D97_02085 [Clostridia bacterium]|nr:hypothetical protein [Clostridia bacterium]
MNIRRVFGAFGIGVVLLAITYLLIYVIGGEDAYTSEIAILFNHKVLFKEVAWSGIICVSFTYLIEVYKNMMESRDYKLIGVLVFEIVFLTVVIFATSKMNKIYISESIEDLFYGLLLISFMLDTCVSMVAYKIEEKTLNQKLKERNNK